MHLKLFIISIFYGVAFENDIKNSFCAMKDLMSRFKFLAVKQLNFQNLLRSKIKASNSCSEGQYGKIISCKEFLTHLNPAILKT